MTPTTRSELTLEKVRTTTDNLTGWYTAPHSKENCLVVTFYDGQHPKAQDASNYVSGGHPSFLVRYHHESDMIDIGKQKNSTKIRFESLTFKQELTSFFETQRTAAEDTAMYRFATPDSIREALENNYNSVYDVLTTPKEELRQINQLGEKRLEKIKHHGANELHIPNWAFLTICPECNEEFWSTSQANKNTDTPPTIDNIQSQTYCPVCYTNEIPTTYIDTPEPFSSKP